MLLAITGILGALAAIGASYFAFKILQLWAVRGGK